MMKKHYLLVPLMGIFLYITLSSDKNGRGGNLTGSPGATGTGCGSCHGSVDPSVHIQFVLDSAGVPVTRYKAGGVYTLKMIGTNNSTTSLPKFGFQMVTTKGSSQAGSFSTVPSGARIVSVGGVSVLGHNAPNVSSSGSGAMGTTYTVSAGWTAPVAGTGTVSVYGIVNAVNGNNNDDGGDNWNNGMDTFTELTSASHVAVDVVSSGLQAVKAYPVPFVGQFTLELGQGPELKNVVVYDLNGKAVVNASTNYSEFVISTGNWPAGVYVVVVSCGAERKTLNVVK